MSKNDSSNTPLRNPGATYGSSNKGTGVPPSTTSSSQGYSNNAGRKRNEEGRKPSSSANRVPPANKSSKKSSKKQKKDGGVIVKNHWMRALVMVLSTLALCVFLAFFILRSASDMFGLSQPDVNVSIEVPEGSTLQDVTTLLKSQNVVEQSLTFRMYAGMKLTDADIVPGYYDMNQNWSYTQIVAALRTGNLEDQVVTITFLENYTMQDIADALEENGVCDATEFIEYMDTTDFSQYSFYEQIPDNANRYHKMEGYLFPDTYTFYKGEYLNSIAKKFLDNFETKAFDDDLKEQMEKMGMTMDETITLASIIQKEAGLEAQNSLVSSVFHNRLNSQGTYPYLQSDVTLLYAENYIKPYQHTQEMLDAYNTYVCKGLPAGPIANPGRLAIEAALYPADTNNYFFVTDVNMKYYYASTVAEHEANIALAEAEDTSGTGQVHGIYTKNDLDLE